MYFIVFVDIGLVLVGLVFDIGYYMVVSNEYR